MCQTRMIRNASSASLLCITFAAGMSSAGSTRETRIGKYRMNPLSAMISAP